MTTPIVTPVFLLARHPEYPELALMEEQSIQNFIDEAEEEMSEDAWGELYNLGVHMMAMHLLVLDKRARDAAITGGLASGGASTRGAIKWEQVGVLQRGYADPTSKLSVGVARGSDAWLESTPFGSRWARLLEKIFPARIL